MLFDFHKSQNGQKPSSVYATYLVYGVKRDEAHNGDEDVEMSSSSPGAAAESLPEPTCALALIQEDMLKGKSRIVLAYHKGLRSHAYYQMRFPCIRPSSPSKSTVLAPIRPRYCFCPPNWAYLSRVVQPWFH